MILKKLYLINRLFVRRWLFALLFTSLSLCLWFGQVVSAQSTAPELLIQKGIESYELGNYQNAIVSWQTALTQYQKINDHSNTAIVLENLARAYQQLGQSEDSIAYWDRLLSLNHQHKDLVGILRVLIEQAQVYSSSGQPKKAIALLCNADNTRNCTRDSALQLLQNLNNPDLEAAALGSLGDAYRLTGNKEAIAVLQKSLELSQNPTYQISAMTSLGNAYRSNAQTSYRRANSARQRGENIAAEKLQQAGMDEDRQALTLLEKSIAFAQTQNNAQAQMRSLLSAIPLIDADRLTAMQQQAIKLLSSLPQNQERVYAAIELTRLLQPQGTTTIQCLAILPQAAIILQSAIATAQKIHNRRAESFALGELGHFYECQGDYTQALSTTQKARFAAEQEKDSLYLWEWQTGRILAKLGKITEAIRSEERAITTLETIRSELITATRDLQYDFRDLINPLYRELVTLKLSQVQPIGFGKSLTKENPQNLDSALKTIDSLKLAELRNYFGNDCVLTTEKGDVVVANATAIFNTIILEDRTAVVLSLPDGEKKFAWIEIKRQSLIEEINQWRRELESFFDPYNRKQSQKIYNWIVRLFEDTLAQAQIKTLVFVQDGILQSVPMSALYDGEQFLIQKYAIATTPSLSLTSAKKRQHKLRALALGLTKSSTIDGREFPALTNVATEIQQVQEKIPGSKQLLNREFTRDRLQQELNQQSYSIVHIATHGEFGTQPEETFLVIGNNQKLTFTELDNVIRQASRGQEPIDLLMLTACETAVGDDRAALGLAGVSVQAGVRSAIASLWSINDPATVNIASEFYLGLHNSNLSKAEALRNVQIALIKDGIWAHPAYWAPFVLVGNWL